MLEDIKSWLPYMGVPVFVQLKVSIVVAHAAEKQVLHYSGRTERQWVPRALNVTANSEDPNSPVMNASTDVIEFAVLRETDDPDFIEVQWPVPSQHGAAIIATLLPIDSIAQVTRVVSVPEEPPLVRI